MSTEVFRLPDVGEGLTEAAILTWHVSVGDTVTVNQAIVDIETAKSVVELPSPFAGTVAELVVQAGETAEVGSPLVRIDSAGTSTPAPETRATEQAAEDVSDEPKFLVGYGAREPQTRRRRRRSPAPDTDRDAATQTTAVAGASPEGKPRAKPPVRKLAKVLGVDLATVEPTGPDGTIVRTDVLAVAGRTEAAAAGEDGRARTNGADVVRHPIRGVRKVTAAAMVSSAFTAPHVTEFVTIDVSETLQLKNRVQTRPEFGDIKLTPLVFVARAYLLALARTPMGNARWDEAAQEIVVPTTVNLGIAAATPRGLVVPNVKSAQSMGLRDLAEAINVLAANARTGKTQPAEMSGGTTTITNIGVFGVDTGTPILNPGEATILAVGAIRKMPWVVTGPDGDQIEPRSVMQLALSFDHRVMDGQQGSGLLVDTAARLSDPGLGLL